MTSVNGLINVESPYNVYSTTARLERMLKELGMNIIARVDHADNAGKVSQALRPTLLLIFGNPEAGTHLIRATQSAAIDLPQKLLVWEDENRKVWVSYNDPQYLGMRHAMTECNELLDKIAHTLNRLVNDVVNSDVSPEPVSG